MGFTTHEDEVFKEGFQNMQLEVHENARQKGFWDGVVVVNDEQGKVVAPHNFGEKCMLQVTEIAESVEKHRKTIGKGKPDEPDEHCPQFGSITIEFADAIIRIMDTHKGMIEPQEALPGNRLNHNLAEAIVAKAAFNRSRPHMHGKAY